MLFNIGCPLSLFYILMYFHTNIKATEQYDDNASYSLMVKNEVNQGYVSYIK